MNDEQVWNDLARFALAMKRGAKVAIEDEDGAELNYFAGDICASDFKNGMRIREIIEPPARKIRPLNAEEWRGVEGCWKFQTDTHPGGMLRTYDIQSAAIYAARETTCHPPGFPADVRNLWVEE